MDKPPKRPIAFLVFVITLVFILLFAGGIYLINYLLYPRLLDVWKTYLISFASSLGISLALLSSLAQITGYSIKEMFSNLPSGNSGKQDDFIQRSKKRKTTSVHSDEIIKIMDELQASLYSDNNKLPMVLTKCLALAELTNLSQADKEWVSRELNGYQYLFYQDREVKYLKDGVDALANHRLIEPHIKMQFFDAETQLPDVLSLLKVYD